KAYTLSPLFSKKIQSSDCCVRISWHRLGEQLVFKQTRVRQPRYQSWLPMGIRGKSGEGR
ncbi:MAG: hypothetical protein KDB22_29645, partial [Planctomycetales bacterium]|nr:hypothetical protein [Planctomycetales bacterium]